MRYYLNVMKQDGSILEGFPLEFTSWTWGELVTNIPAALIDMDNDGFLEMVMNIKEGGLYVVEYSGVMSDYYPSYGDFESLILLGENDGSPLSNKTLYYFDEAGLNAMDNQTKRISGFPIALSEPQDGLLFDTGQNTCGVAITEGNAIYAYGIDDTGIIWDSRFGDKGNGSAVDTLFTPIVPLGDELMPGGQVYNWPNPNNPGENFTNIRYYLNYPAQINIRIYDQAGDMVDELFDSGIANAPNETVWDLSKISSGVYFARVEAYNSSKKSVHFVKIAVIK